MRRAIAVACVVLPLALAAVAYTVWHRAYRTPPPRDLVAEFAAVEGTQGVHEPGAWRALTDLDRRFARTFAEWSEANAVTFEREHDPMLGPPPDPEGYSPSMIHHTREDMAGALEVMQAELDPDDPLHGEALRSFIADNTLARLYAESDLHQELDAVFALPGLVPPPLGEMVERHGTWSSVQSATRHIELAETARLRLALETGDTSGAIDAMHSLDAVARMRLHTPGAESHLLALSGWESVIEALVQHLRRGRPEREVVEAALPMMTNIYKDMRSLAIRAIRADRVLAHASIALVYAGDGQFESPDTLRLFWPSHLEMARTLDRVYDEYERYFREGPGTTEEPAIIDELWEAGGNAHLYAPIHSATSMVLQRLDKWYIAKRCTSGGAALMLAIEAHRVRSDALPATLDTLVETGIIEELPADPYAPDGRYLYDINPDTPLGYTLRSVFHDGAPSPIDRWTTPDDLRAMLTYYLHDEFADLSFTPLPGTAP